MSKLILSTSNIMGGGTSAIRHGRVQKSNTEFITALQSNFGAAQKAAQHRINGDPTANGASAENQRFPTWISSDNDQVFIPRVNFEASGLLEERTSYEITVKLFFLPHKPASCRCAQTRQAIDLVLKELHVSFVDLLIVSYPGITFDADAEDGELSDTEEVGPNDKSESNAESIESMIETWACLEELHEEGVIAKLGVAEFGSERLSKFIAKSKVKPQVNQINVRDCCVVPKPLILYAKSQGVELLTHDDCQNILPSGTLRELLGQGDRGAKVLASDASEDSTGLRGDLEPQWVMKYTAVVTDRGVIENKGYFALAELHAK